MALRKQLTFSGVTEVKTEHGVISEADTQTHLNAYIKVDEVRTSKNSAIVTISLTDANKRLVMTTTFAPSVEIGAKNIIAQAYDSLKQMPLFSGAEDC